MTATATIPDPAHLRTVADRVATAPMGEQSTLVLLDGRVIGSFCGGAAHMDNGRPHANGSYRFPDPAAALAGIVSAATRGWWTGEGPAR